MDTSTGEITLLLQQWRAGDAQAESRLFVLMMPELQKIAARVFRREDPGHTLQPTALINEAFLRLASAKHVDWRDRGHFLALAARIMRHHLIDHARSQPSIEFLTMDGVPEHILGEHNRWELVVAVDALLNELDKESQQRRAVVELKFFLGLTDTEAADSLGLTLHTFQREWYRARKWLFTKLSSEPWKAPPKTTGA